MASTPEIKQCVFSHFTVFPAAQDIQTPADREKLATAVEKNRASAELKNCLRHLNEDTLQFAFQSYAARIWLDSPDGINEINKISEKMKTYKTIPTDFAEGLREVEGVPGRLRVYGDAARDLFVGDEYKKFQTHDYREKVVRGILGLLLGIGPGALMAEIVSSPITLDRLRQMDPNPSSKDMKIIKEVLGTRNFDEAAAKVAKAEKNRVFAGVLGALPGLIYAGYYVFKAESEYTQVLGTAVKNARPPAFEINNWPNTNEGLIDALARMEIEAK